MIYEIIPKSELNYNCSYYSILHKSFGKNANVITCYIKTGVLAIIANFVNNLIDFNCIPFVTDTMFFFTVNNKINESTLGVLQPYYR